MYKINSATKLFYNIRKYSVSTADGITNMSKELILYHYPQSPFAEKVRTAMGLKNLKWFSVITNRIPPRPHLDVLTGGYRRIPVLQVGADIRLETDTKGGIRQKR
ncbi:unnamed protein product [Rotaria magnacalcarata]